MTATIAGVRFSDQLAALLDHAEANGFRIEAETRKGRFGGVVVYAPDKTVAPISVQEEKAKFNPAHYDNIRRAIYRAGCPVLPGDKRAADETDDADTTDSAAAAFERLPGVVLANSREEALAAAPEGATVIELGGIGMVADDGSDMARILHDEDLGPKFVAEVVLGLMKQTGAGDAEAALTAMVTKTVAAWVTTFSTKAMEEAVAKAATEIRRGYEKEINEALRMASEHEATAKRATKALEAAEAREAKARADCGEAIARAKVAEAKASELEAALRPLRAVLNAG